MFDFIVFFLIFIPLMDIIRHMRTTSMVVKVLITAVITSVIGSYFVYTSILAGKSQFFGISNLLFMLQKNQ